MDSVQADFVQLRRENGQLVDSVPARNPGFIAYEERTIKLEAGDRIQFTQGDKTIGYKSREAAEVASVDPRANELLIGRGNGEAIALPLPRPLMIDYGYAATAHGSQGTTVDRVILDIDTRNKTTNDAAYYVEISRAPHEAKIFTNDRSKLPEAIQRQSEKTAALDVAYGRGLEARLVPTPAVQPIQPQPNVVADMQQSR